MESKWRRLFPNWRYWAEPPAIATLAGGLFWLVIGVTGIPDVNIAWQFLAFGFVLTFFSWWTVAYASSRADRQADAIPAKVAERVMEALGYKPQIDAVKLELAEAKGDTEKERRAREHLTTLYDQVIAHFDSAQSARGLATDALGDIASVLASDIGTGPMVRQIEERWLLYQKENVQRILNDKLLMPGGEPQLLPSSPRGEPIPLDTPLGDIGADEE